MQVIEARELPDPPLLRLENEAGNAYLSMLTTLYSEGQAAMIEGVQIESRLLHLCSAVLDSFEASLLLPADDDAFYFRGFIAYYSLSHSCRIIRVCSCMLNLLGLYTLLHVLHSRQLYSVA